nr:inner membrane CreD family protein [Bacteroidota bacterium]
MVKINRKLYVLPESLDINGIIDPEIRYRGIYKVIVYESDLNINGKFQLPDFNKIGVFPENIDWKNSSVVVGLTDMRGIQNDIKIAWQGKIISVDPGIENKTIARSGFTAKVPVSDSSGSINFNLNIDLNGSKGLYFTPSFYPYLSTWVLIWLI